VPDGEYQLRTEATTDYDSASALVRAGADSVVLNVQPKSSKALLVHGVVESSRGKPLDAVRVELVGRPALSAFSDAEGRYSLRIESSGRLQNPAVRFTRKGYRDFVAPIAAAPAQGSADVVQNARLEEIGDGSTLAGSVHGTDGGTVNGATIELYSAALSRSYRASTDHNGTFTIRNVEQAIDYRLWVRPTAKYRDRTLDNVIIGGSIDVVVDAIAAATVTGHFVTPENQPVPAFTMWLTPAFGANRAMAVTSDSSGAFTITNVPEGPFVLGTRAAPMLSVTGLEASSKPSGDLRIPLDVGMSRLEGTLVGDDGRPVGGARLSLHWSSGIGMSSTSSRDTVTDANGYFLFTQLGAGNHALAVTATGYRALQRAVAVGPVNAPITLTLQRGH
jgi:protocatechuate 3,4-dioxygenase beta subunit